MKLNKGFTLIEMLVVIGIITILIGASIAGFSKMTKTAEKAKAQELVSNVATALTSIFQKNGSWPKRLAANGGSDGQLDADAALALVKESAMSLSADSSASRLIGLDRFGIISPWATAAIKRVGNSASLSTKVSSGKTVQDHILHYALDLDGDGIIKGASVGGVSVNVRATAIVWCGGKDGVIQPYAGGSSGSGGGRGANSGSSAGSVNDDVYSWTIGQTKNVE